MDTHPRQSFWQFRINWLVVGLPLTAVVASISTLFIAIANPDPVIKPHAQQSELRPAVEGRNHAMNPEPASRDSRDSQKPAEP